MKAKIDYTHRRGLPGGPNEQFTYVTGIFSVNGYRDDSPDVNNPFNVIPSGRISMREHDGTPLKKGPILGIDNLGNKKMMQPGKEYQFPGEYVTEIPQMQFGGMSRRKVDKILNANKDLNFVQRLYQENTPSIMIPGQTSPSTHFMESADGKVYPTVVQMPDGTLQYLGDNAYNYAMETGEYIQFPNDRQATRFGKSYKKGTGVLQEFAEGGLLKAQDGNETTEQDNFLKNWFTNRQMPTQEGQKLLEKVRPEAIERASQNVPYVMTDQLPKDVAGYYDTEDKNIYLNQTYTPEQINSTKEHERVHYVQDGDKFYKVLDTPHRNLVEQNIREPKEINTGNPEWDKNVKENYDDIVAQEEMHARIMTLRRLAGFKPDQVITEEMLNNYFNSVKDSGKTLDPDIEDLKAVTKGNSSIVNLLNDMVSVPQKKDTVSYAQEGGELDLYKKYINGDFDGSPEELEAKKVYDKLNRVYYKPAKEAGMSVPNYIMSNVLTL